MVVSLENLSSYVSLVSHWLLVEGVSTQMEAVREGFTSVFPIASLQMFYPGTLHRSYSKML
jgi:E3 ubiquitin-protein ligase TRIP12